jgi:hypothetical protein
VPRLLAHFAIYLWKVAMSSIAQTLRSPGWEAYQVELFFRHLRQEDLCRTSYFL